ncbi:hypothetical protein E1161_23530 [Saccharopolyspora aridisoli]|uniref:Uncharacterized protein n=1 Tax=Saccharopolyspora aridisoli TaxID=2530385 RepID=A0A4R4UAR2_9PSEU|nr:hypothetical protein [Saccharopolyspora aridisoli]TDC88607.1 hypothetical protein E1161_23530 [Saccharopolyspora aridisoli]
MRDLTDTEQAHLESFNEIRECEYVVVDFEHEGVWGEEFGDLASVFEDLPDWEGTILDPSLAQGVVGISELSSCWHTVDTRRHLSGEFSITEFYECLLRRPPDLGWDGSPPDEIRFFSELRVIDDTPRAANGLMGAVRIQKDVNPLEIWYYDKDLSRTPGFDLDYLRMDLDYHGYLDALLLTKGTFGWQYLFTEAPLHNERFREIAADLKYMLELFPNIFPDHDYTDLAKRLEDRL